MVEPQGSIVRFEEASLRRDEPKTNRTGGKAREKLHRHPHGEVSLDNADAVIDALPRFLQGQGGGLTIQMWVNKATKTIESAWPQ